MDNLRGIIEYIRNLFVHPTVDIHRKRRAVDPLESFDNFLSPKCRRIHISMADNLDNDWRTNRRRPSLKTSPRLSSKQNCHIDTVVLDDDDDDVIEIKKPDIDLPRSKSKAFRYTSTPAGNSSDNLYRTNGLNDDDIKFVKEIISPKEKKTEAAKVGLNYIKPFTGRYLNIGSLQNGTKPKEKTLFNNISKKSSRPTLGCSSLDYSYRLEDKLQYKKLLESAAGNSTNDSSIYHTPVGRLFRYDTSNRSGKIMSMLHKSSTDSNSLSNSKERMSTKDRIIKVLDDFETVDVKDSDSDSDVVIVNPPSPKPDIKVDPVNSFKKVVDTSLQTKSGWLDELVENHRHFVNERQKEINQLRKCSEKHEKINNDLRWELLTDKVNRSLSIRDAILPVDDKEQDTEFPVLTEAQLKLVDHAFRGDPNEIIARKFNLNVSRRDIKTLAGLNWLNDEVINFYMNLIIERGKDSKWPRAYAFNTFFYTKLLKDGAQSLRRWTKRVDIFDHDIICVPIHLGMHWCMAIIDFRDRSIRYYDSMGNSNNKCLDALRRYLEAEHMDKKKAAFDTSDFILENEKDIPQQMNGCDCGMFACTFAEFLTRNAKLTFSQEHMPYLREKMVVEIITGELLIK